MMLKIQMKSSPMARTANVIASFAQRRSLVKLRQDHDQQIGTAMAQALMYKDEWSLAHEQLGTTEG